MRRPLAVWLGIGAGIAALDVWCDRNATVGDTASECTREVLDLLPGGRRLWFPICWAALSAWLVPHICD